MNLPELLRARPILQAPMAGGASTPALVHAVSGAGGLGALAAGYLSAEALGEQIDGVRGLGTDVFGVNVFVPSGAPAPEPALADYRSELAGDARRHGTEVGPARHDDDSWDAKVDLLASAAVPLVSFTFGCPSAGVLERLREAGSATVVTATTVDEARTAVSRGADGVCVQGVEAGGHRATFDPARGEDRPLLELLPEVVRAVEVPVIAAGGIMTGADAAAALAAGAVAVQLGTAFLRCPESGAHPPHKAALADPAFTGTALTRAFTGRPARGLTNRFMREHPGAPAAYPEVHHMTRPLRAAAARRSDPEGMALWAGTGFRQARELPAAELVARLYAEAAEAGARFRESLRT
ncbi:oxidoreductase [Nocardiopsis terrae]|uniref:Propionate 3-nitronate monooxygenase n=1 Tax=Nocardiopsis terrae TaxID=372655 RepID=A0ABR9HAZ5_9ACTN|nr:nitronate monooxygenase [Nocardiopsis terrae]MBE1456173.1 nitronate monooxygenase [Nocardiopsis terrae]GHC97995.1 oxidoreductase [Nocardiopsis terrae]